MNRADITELSLYQTIPCITLIVPGQNSPERFTQTQMLLKEASQHDQLRSVEPAEAEHLMKNWQAALKRIETYPSVPGIVVCINQRIARLYTIPTVPEAQVTVQLSFDVRSIEQLLYRGLRYWVLAVIDHKARLFDGYEQVVTPTTHVHSTQQGDEESFDVADTSGNVCEESAWTTACRYRSAKDFVSALDLYLEHMTASDPLPIVLVGDETIIEQMKIHSRYAAYIAVDLATSSLPKQLGPITWPTIRVWYQKRLTQGMHDLALADEAKLVLSSPERVWHALRIERSTALFVEQDHELTGCENQIKGRVSVGSTCDIHSKPLNVIDDCIKIALDRHIPVYLCPPKKLEKYGGIALITHSIHTHE